MKQCSTSYVDKQDARKHLSLKNGVENFHKKFVLAAKFEKMHYINILKQEHSSAKIYEHNLFDKRYIVDRYRCHVAGKFGVVVDKDPGKRHLLYWIPKLHTIPYKFRLLLNLNSKQTCTHLLTVIFTSD